ncbi:hypothetical protein [uncultured Brevibacterium sp.]|uniref:hypothetical protein n=1 Tax=uncultured Brevibacterium sp. TaxID=189678 RepID=UPI0025D5E0AF|nr:hypothetical protein [uncultured Brevibacterium sp.]
MHRRRFPARQSGQGTIEYIGIAVIAAIIIAGIIATPMAPNMTSGLEKIICGVLKNSPFGGPEMCSPPKPPKCITATNSTRNGNEAGIKVVSFKSGQGYTVTEYSDGSVDVAITDDYSIEGNFGLKNTKLKGNGLSLALSVSGTYGNTSKYRFASMEDAAELIQQAEDRTNSGHKYVPGGSIANERPAGEDASTHEFSLKGGGEADFSLQELAKGKSKKNDGQSEGSDGSEGEGNSSKTGDTSADAGAGASIELGVKGQTEHDKGANKDDPSDDTYKHTVAASIDGEAGLKGKLSAKDIAALKGKFGGNLGAESLVSIKTDANGEITNITFTTASEYGGQAKAEGTVGPAPKNKKGDEVANNVGGSESGSDSTKVVTTTSVDINTPEDREAVQRFLMNPKGDPMAFVASAFPEVGDYGAEMSPMAQLMRDKGYTRRNHYDANTDKSRDDYIFYATESETKSTTLRSSEVLTDDGSGGRSWQPDETCKM